MVKADVQGSVEAVTDQLMKIPQEKIKLRIIRSGAGAITEGDVLLAAASNAVVIGFNVRPERKAAETAERDKVEIRLYTVIYDAVDEMKKAHGGPARADHPRGAAGRGRGARRLPASPRSARSPAAYVTDGKVNRNAQVRLLRDNVVIHTGKVVVAEALQGRRQRGEGRPGVRHRHRQLQRHQARRRHRVLHHREGQGDAVGRPRLSIGLLILELHLPQARSLKDKRQVLRGFETRVRNRFNVSLAEVEHQDLWQRARLAVVGVNSDQAHLEKTLQAITEEAYSLSDAEVASADTEFL